jgi:putative oxidoreductase
MRNSYGGETVSDAILLAARICLVLLFLIFGWQKLTGFGGTVAYFSHTGVPLPQIAAAVAVTMEFFVGLAIALGFLTRPLALLLALYTLATAIIGHHFWSLSGAAQFENEINFFKNVSIIGGLLLLYVTGAGRFSVDHKIGPA